MKKSITTLCLISGFMIAGVEAPAMAQGTHPAKQGATEDQHTRSMDRAAATQKRLADLKQKLNLKPTQQSAWDTFSAAFTAQAKGQAQARENMRSGSRDDYEKLSTPAKMEKMAAMMRSSADSLSKTASDTKTFYEVLTSEQKTIFDLFAKDRWNHRMREHMHHGMR